MTEPEKQPHQVNGLGWSRQANQKVKQLCSKSGQKSSRSTRWIATAILLLAATLLLAYVVYTASSHLVTGRVGTRIGQTMANKFPPVVICPKVWIALEKSSLGLVNATREYRYLLSKLPVLDEAETEFLLGKEPFTSFAGQEYDFLNAALQKSINKKYGTARNMIKHMMMEPSVVIEVRRRPRETIQLLKAPTTRGGCYLVNHTGETAPALVPHAELALHLKKLVSSGVSEQRRHHRIAFGNSALAPFAGGYITFTQDLSVYISATHYRRLYNHNDPCAYWTQKERLKCLYNCYNEKVCDSCKLIDLSKNFSGVCSFIDQSQLNHNYCLQQLSTDGAREFEQVCAKDCPEHCEETIYHKTVVGKPSSDEEGANVYIKLQHTTDSVNHYEVYIYGFSDFISDIASVLWMFLATIYIVFFRTNRTVPN